MTNTKKAPSKYAQALTQRRKQYSFDVAMRVAAKRCEDHPVPISMTSNIRTWTDKGE